MRADEVMTRDPMTISPGASVAEAVRAMLDARVSGLPVVDEAGRLVGVITEGDLLVRAELGTEKKRAKWLEFLFGPGRSAEDYVQAHGRRVEEVMTRTPITVAPTTGLDEVVETMIDQRVKRLPVVEGESLVGVVSRADVLRALSGVFAEAPAAPVEIGDAELVAEVKAALAGHGWAPSTSLDIRAVAGEVELWGSILDERQREAIRVAVENVPGVKAIVDHMVWVEPFSGTVVSAPGDRGT
ncbi:MAG: CBS domain-containing protein [Siculibacillus sp.]|nr:CBS domain-containing protein [Siculibacillus sp.]